MKKPLLLFSILVLGLRGLTQQKEISEHKLSQRLSTVLLQPSDDSIDLICSVKDLAAWKAAKTTVRTLSVHASSKTVIVRIATKNLWGFIQDSTLEFADVLRKPKEELTTGAFDLTLNKVNLAHHIYTNINGGGIQASVKEQLLDSTDIDWKGRFFNSGVAAATQTSHASIMATLLAGGGNSSIYATGAATGARITSSSFESLLPDADSVYAGYHISVQNHSYGTGIENFYGADARAYDISVNTNPSLLHVFSAGNSGGSAATDGIYAGIQGFANMTGSFKMAKNIITVGSVDSFNTVMPLSSKGPAYDGRVKPELVAYGEDGSSGAAAVTSGTAALLQQAYQLTHQDALPPAALVKAVLLNSADDIGTKGPDYTSGYGSLNAFNALQTVDAGHFFEGAVSQDEVKVFPLAIPSNAKQVKITLTWDDIAAAANAGRALVNDLDAALKLPSASAAWQPWVLSSFPHLDSLQLAAVRKKDTLNNVEQISVDDPPAGDYLLEVRGSRLSTSSQGFAIAYQIDTANSFIWSYPTGSDVLPSAAVGTIRWQTNIRSDAQIEYSLNGTDWQVVAPAVNTDRHYFQWPVPDTTSRALLRMVIPSLQKIIVSDTFVISKELNLNIGFNCPDSILLWWNQLPVDNYEIYQLGQQYLEPVGATTDTVKVFQKSGHPSLYYAVAPRIGNRSGLRSYTLNYTTQGVGCYLRTFFAILQNGGQALLSAALGSLYNVAEVNFQQLAGNSFQTIGTLSPPSSLGFTFTDSSLLEGTNFYRLQIKMTNGQIIYSPVDRVYYLPGNPVLVFPNPARQNESIKIVTQEPGKYTIRIFDGNGRMVRSVYVADILQPMPLLHLSGGMYFIKIISEDGKVYHQKLIVY